MSNGDVVSDAEWRVLGEMGAVLQQVQLIERVIAMCMTFVLQKPNMTAQGLLEQAEKERTRTLGYFLKELRKRADVHQGFDGLLERFLNGRNTFVHNLSEVPGWDLKTIEGRVIASKFLNDLAGVSNYVLAVFVALLREWDKEALHSGITFDHPMMLEIEKKYGEAVKHIFTAKDDGSNN